MCYELTEKMTGPGLLILFKQIGKGSSHPISQIQKTLNFKRLKILIKHHEQELYVSDVFRVPAEEKEIDRSARATCGSCSANDRNSCCCPHICLENKVAYIPVSYSCGPDPTWFSIHVECYSNKQLSKAMPPLENIIDANSN
uniref:Uncharacterized protein n=1 Tax=Strigamia maritima TaxID=126957 RepID=T1J9T0_STRMM